MPVFKVIMGLSALMLAWAILFRTGVIYKINEFMREQVFSDRLVLFSGTRVAGLLLILGGVSLFSGVENIVQIRDIKPQIAATMLGKAREDFLQGRYKAVVQRCQQLLHTESKNVEIWELLANSWLALGDREKARSAASTVLRLQPNHPYKNGPWKSLLEKG